MSSPASARDLLRVCAPSVSDGSREPCDRLIQGPVDAAEDDPVAGMQACVPRRVEHAHVRHARMGGRQRARPRCLRADSRGQRGEDDRVAAPRRPAAERCRLLRSRDPRAKRCQGDDAGGTGVVGAGRDGRCRTAGGDERGRARRPGPMERTTWGATASPALDAVLLARCEGGAATTATCSDAHDSGLPPSSAATRSRPHPGQKRENGGISLPHSCRRRGARCVAARSTSSSSARRRSSSTSSEQRSRTSSSLKRFWRNISRMSPPRSRRLSFRTWSRARRSRRSAPGEGRKTRGDRRRRRSMKAVRAVARRRAPRSSPAQRMPAPHVSYRSP